MDAEWLVLDKFGTEIDENKIVVDKDEVNSDKNERNNINTVIPEMTDAIPEIIKNSNDDVIQTVAEYPDRSDEDDVSESKVEICYVGHDGAYIITDEFDKKRDDFVFTEKSINYCQKNSISENIDCINETSNTDNSLTQNIIDSMNSSNYYTKENNDFFTGCFGGVNLIKNLGKRITVNIKNKNSNSLRNDIVERILSFISPIIMVLCICYNDIEQNVVPV